MKARLRELRVEQMGLMRRCARRRQAEIVFGKTRIDRDPNVGTASSG